MVPWHFGLQIDKLLVKFIVSFGLLGNREPHDFVLEIRVFSRSLIYLGENEDLVVGNFEIGDEEEDRLPLENIDPYLHIINVKCQ